MTRTLILAVCLEVSVSEKRHVDLIQVLALPLRSCPCMYILRLVLVR